MSGVSTGGGAVTGGVRKRTTAAPTLATERGLARAGARLVAGFDEVGRGALAGPVTVGMVIVDASVVKSLAGVRDSKLLRPAARDDLVPRIHRWASAHAVGHASAAEIDKYGLSAALRLAGYRAWRAGATEARVPDAVILDGSFNWLAEGQPDLFAAGCAELADCPVTAPVQTKVKADMTCQSVAAASVLAKVERDSIMVDLHQEYPHFNWAENKGYATAEHRQSIRHTGACGWHRRTWNLFGDSPL